MADFLSLTSTGKEAHPILINVNNIAVIYPTESNTSIIYTTNEKYTYVKESFEMIFKLLTELNCKIHGK